MIWNLSERWPTHLAALLEELQLILFDLALDLSQHLLELGLIGG